MQNNKRRIQISSEDWKVIVMIVMTLIGALQSNSLRIDIDSVNVVVIL